jgi:hypothetical protein
LIRWRNRCADVGAGPVDLEHEAVVARDAVDDSDVVADGDLELPFLALDVELPDRGLVAGLVHQARV